MNEKNIQFLRNENMVKPPRDLPIPVMLEAWDFQETFNNIPSRWNVKKLGKYIHILQKNNFRSSNPGPGDTWAEEWGYLSEE